MNKELEKAYAVAAKDYEKEFAANPELASRGDVLQDFALSTEVGSFIWDADVNALGSYSRSYDAQNGRRRGRGEEFTPEVNDVQERKAQEAYERRVEKEVAESEFSVAQVGEWSADIFEVYQRVLALPHGPEDDDDFVQEQVDGLLSWVKPLAGVARKRGNTGEFEAELETV